MPGLGGLAACDGGVGEYRWPAAVGPWQRAHSKRLCGHLVSPPHPSKPYTLNHISTKESAMVFMSKFLLHMH